MAATAICVSLLFFQVLIFVGIILILHGKKKLKFNDDCSDDNQCGQYVIAGSILIGGSLFFALMLFLFKKTEDSGK